jgi:hypothetical protein
MRHLTLAVLAIASLIGIRSSAQQLALQSLNTIASSDDDFLGGIVFDAGGNQYATGQIRRITDMDAGPAIAPFSAAGQQQLFVQKLDATGAFVWAVRTGGNDVCISNDIAIDQDGNAVIGSSTLPGTTKGSERLEGRAYYPHRGHARFADAPNTCAKRLHRTGPVRPYQRRVPGS